MGMDFNFKYDRHKPSPAVRRERRRKEQQTVLNGRQLAYGLAIPGLLLSGPLAGWWIGSWLDKQLGTQFVMILLILLGLVAGLWNAVDMLAKLTSGGSSSNAPQDHSQTRSRSTSPGSDSPED